MRHGCPLYLQERTFSVAAGMSAKCQKRTSKSTRQMPAKPTQLTFPDEVSADQASCRSASRVGVQGAPRHCRVVLDQMNQGGPLLQLLRHRLGSPKPDGPSPNGASGIMGVGSLGRGCAFCVPSTELGCSNLDTGSIVDVEFNSHW